MRVFSVESSNKLVNMSLVAVQDTMDPVEIFYDAEEEEDEDDQIEDLISPISYKSSSSSVSTNETESYVKAVVLDLVKKYCMKSPVFANAKTDQVSPSKKGLFALGNDKTLNTELLNSVLKP